MKEKKTGIRRIIKFLLIGFTFVVVSIITMLAAIRYLNGQPHQLKKTQNGSRTTKKHCIAPMRICWLNYLTNLDMFPNLC